MDALATEFSRAHATLTESAGRVKELRKRTRELQTALLKYMQDHGIDECNVSGLRLVRKTTRKTEGLKKEHIEGELRRLGVGEKVDEAVTNMYNRRLTDVQETLAVVKADAPST